MTDGVLDTNVLLHGLTRDEHSEECSAFLECLSRGELRVRLDPCVIHEFTYALPRIEKGWSKERIVETLLLILDWPGIECDRPLLKATLSRWLSKPGVSFVDALLWAEASRSGASVYRINKREFVGAGVDVPSPLPLCRQ
jgi:predicted nucleic acid-binding protein